MATILDTSALIVLVRRRRPPGLEPVAEAARGELEAGRALVSVVTAAELVVGARDADAVERLTGLLDRLAVVDAGREVGLLAGRMGADARSAGRPIPVPDLLIAATAVWLDLPLLTCDSDFARGMELGAGRDADDPAAAADDDPWASLRLHPASCTG